MALRRPPGYSPAPTEVTYLSADSSDDAIDIMSVEPGGMYDILFSRPRAPNLWETGSALHQLDHRLRFPLLLQFPLQDLLQFQLQYLVGEAGFPLPLRGPIQQRSLLHNQLPLQGLLQLPLRDLMQFPL
ncbi:Uu.00g128830.m01.CDS01 [Anthostomella pinea]|uniref:Uu.00g128830.m01.CDS01 n=1 Tax=Anthostomella pinea TaxID=933095 RepID=A0AAI8YI06_9PEZI|nr:Uu.00g128830.m01.CDS01 [Anthostomella pinea]